MLCKTPLDVLCQILNCSSVACSPLTEDGSNRQYFRITPDSFNTPPLILMQIHNQDALDLKNDRYSWISISEVLNSNSVFVPKIHGIIKEYDAIIIEDFGDQTLDIKISESSDKIRLEIYKSPVEDICKFIKIKPSGSSPWSTRGFDYTLLKKELDFFKNQFLENLKEFQNDRDREKFSQEAESLSRHIGRLPQYFTHRDFHSRNLMLHQNKIGVIDFQDARWGPSAYDLCSLCFDPYVNLNYNMRSQLFKQSLEVIGEKTSLALKDEIESTWKEVLLQRMLKAIGSFAFLTKKGKRDYRRYINPTLNNLQYFLQENSEWPYLTKELIPRLIKISHEKA